MDRPTGYFDYAASNPLWPEAATAMAEAASLVGNPSSTHGFGRRARQMLDQARAKAAAFLAVEPAELTFTSGATEANNLLVYGLVRSALAAVPSQAGNPRPAVLASPLEHASVLGPLEELAAAGTIELKLLPVGSDGRVEAGAFRSALTDQTVLVCLTMANNVLGSLQPLAEAAQAVTEERRRRQAAGLVRPVYLASDAVQAAAWLPLRPQADGLDGLVISAHKCGGPKGVGLLWFRAGLKIEPLVRGGGQERGLRSGTENLPGIVGLAAALETAAAVARAESERCRSLRQALIEGLAGACPRARILGPSGPFVLPGTAFVHFPGQAGDLLALRLDEAGLAVSAGSACDAGKRQAPAAVAAAYGPTVGRWGGVRISFGRFTELAEIEDLIAALKRIVG